VAAIQVTLQSTKYCDSTFAIIMGSALLNINTGNYASVGIAAFHSADIIHQAVSKRTFLIRGLNNL
jgi:hypothetical protein